MRSKAVGLALLVAFTLAGPVVAQDEMGMGPSFTLYGGLSLPQGDFGDDSGSDAGLAKTGLGIGFEGDFPLNSPGLSVTGSIFFLMNGVDEDEIEDALEGEWCFGEYGEYVCAEIDNFDVGSYYNVPILVGLKYEAETSPGFSMFGFGQVGMNILKFPKYEFDLEYCEYSNCFRGSSETTFDMGTSFGFSIGGGIVVGQKGVFGLRYLSLGEPEVDGETEVSISGYSGRGEDFEAEQSVSILLLFAGVRF
ncbi:MAG: hypothetical protein FJY88_08490 [Candidatus Eisenbacteria bacterium]|nr:hypothetical protein [Candidatus Eisenbacteria bacterium]